LLIAVLEATVLLVMRFASWHESKRHVSRGNRAREVAGHRVVKPAPKEYNTDDPEGETNHAAYLSAGSSAVDEDVHEKAERPDRKRELPWRDELYLSPFGSAFARGVRRGLDVARHRRKVPADEQLAATNLRREQGKTE
jgi:hypothetical protein